VKACSKCGVLRPLDEYGIHHRDLRGDIVKRSDCKPCVREKSNREKLWRTRGDNTRPYSFVSPDGKTCSKCYEFKALAEYSLNGLGVHGKQKYYPHCKSCARKTNLTAVRRAQFRAYVDRQQAGLGTGAWHAKRHRHQKRYRESHPGKVRVRAMLRRAVKAGLIQKAAACEKCTRTDRPLHGHHPDYSKPLEVIWLCAWCHNDTHRQEGARHAQG